MSPETKHPAKSAGPPTQEMVARRAGVSQSAVSLVFVGKGGAVSERMRRKVLNAARQLNYNPELNMEARRLTSRRAGNRLIPYGTLGLLWDRQTFIDGVDAFSARIMAGAAAASSRLNLSLLVRSLDLADSSQWPPIGQMDGVILPFVNESIHAIAVRHHLPVAAVYVEEPRLPCALVGTDNREVMRLAVEHLKSRGHRRIGYLGLFPKDGMARQRFEAFKTVMYTCGLKVVSEWMVAGYFDITTPGIGWYRGMGEAAFEKLWSQPGRPTAVVCYNDAMAAGVMNAAASRGVKIPEDLSLVGIDGLPEMAPALVLTSVSVGLEEMAWQAVESLAMAIRSGQPCEGRYRVAPHLLPGQSVQTLSTSKTPKRRG